MDDNNEDLFTSLSDETINPDESIDVENERTDDLPREEDENIVSMIQTLLMRLRLERKTPTKVLLDSTILALTLLAAPA